MRIKSLGAVNLKDHPYIIRLKNEDEELADLVKLKPEDMLLRWINYHCKNAGYAKKVENFSGDLKDMNAYLALLSELTGKKELLEKFTLSEKEKAHIIISETKNLGIEPFVKEKDLEINNPKINLIYCAALFNEAPGLIPTENEKFEAA